MEGPGRRSLSGLTEREQQSRHEGRGEEFHPESGSITAPNGSNREIIGHRTFWFLEPVLERWLPAALECLHAAAWRVLDRTCADARSRRAEA